jgi:hypothetical protein
MFARPVLRSRSAVRHARFSTTASGTMTREEAFAKIEEARATTHEVRCASNRVVEEQNALRAVDTLEQFLPHLPVLHRSELRPALGPFGGALADGAAELEWKKQFEPLWALNVCNPINRPQWYLEHENERLRESAVETLHQLSVLSGADYAETNFESMFVGEPLALDMMTDWATLQWCLVPARAYKADAWDRAQTALGLAYDLSATVGHVDFGSTLEAHPEVSSVVAAVKARASNAQALVALSLGELLVVSAPRQAMLEAVRAEETWSQDRLYELAQTEKGRLLELTQHAASRHALMLGETLLKIAHKSFRETLGDEHAVTNLAAFQLGEAYRHYFQYTCYFPVICGSPEKGQLPPVEVYRQMMRLRDGSKRVFEAAIEEHPDSAANLKGYIGALEATDSFLPQLKELYKQTGNWKDEPVVRFEA